MPSGSSKAPCWRWEEPAYQPVTIDLHRLWKGNVPPPGDCVRSARLGVPQLHVGDRFVFFASSRVGPDYAKPLPSSDNSPVMALLQCGGARAADSRFTSQLIVQLCAPQIH